jgi:hypothetical protein
VGCFEFMGFPSWPTLYSSARGNEYKTSPAPLARRKCGRRFELCHVTYLDAPNGRTFVLLFCRSLVTAQSKCARRTDLSLMTVQIIERPTIAS